MQGRRPRPRRPRRSEGSAVVNRRYDLTPGAFAAFLAGKALQRSRSSMDSARTARIQDRPHELVCMYVRHAREGHRDYMADRAKALAVQP